jgi:hypothetical protein
MAAPAGQRLGIFWLLYGVLRIAMAVWLFLFSGTATVMFGALLVRVPNPEALMADFHLWYSAVIVLSIVCGVLGLAAGFALMSGQRYGRRLAVVASFLSVSEIPLGTTLGIITLIVFLRLEPDPSTN